MSNEKFNLGELLNDDSFIRWVKEDDQLSDSQKEKWDDWLSSNEGNADLLRKAKKIISMPFKEADEDCDSELLNRIKEAIKTEKQNPED